MTHPVYVHGRRCPLGVDGEPARRGQRSRLANEITSVKCYVTDGGRAVYATAKSEHAPANFRRGTFHPQNSGLSVPLPKEKRKEKLRASAQNPQEPPLASLVLTSVIRRNDPLSMLELTGYPRFWFYFSAWHNFSFSSTHHPFNDPLISGWILARECGLLLVVQSRQTVYLE